MFQRPRDRDGSGISPEELPEDTKALTPSRGYRKSRVAWKVSSWVISRRIKSNAIRTLAPQSTQLNTSQTTPTSDSHPPTSVPKPKALGLRTIHKPETAPLIDIIFIHGLGGGREKTWSKNPEDPAFFWPERWLPADSEVGRARIQSFGYNADFRPGTPKNIYNIGDFAKELLNEMRFGKDDDGADLEMGKVPIIFVVHSMGGLVAKKAYLFGQNDELYQDIIRSVSAMVFLATPHRGSNLAGVLKKILAASFQAPRAFIDDLSKNSRVLEELNEQFRHVAPKISIWSFYETHVTPIGPIKTLVLNKDSSILGYPKEISRPLDADHHGMCKYRSQEDPNFIAVRNAISSLVQQYRSQEVHRISAEAEALKTLLSVSSGPEENFGVLRQRWLPGTCDWALSDPGINSWLEPKLESCVTWFCAPSGSGKSTMSAHIISHLRESGIPCQFFFFKYDNPENLSLNTFLRSMACQVAGDLPAFKRSLLELSAQGLNLANTSAMFVWKKLFHSLLFTINGSTPMYWIVDGLDQSGCAKALLELLPGIVNSKMPLRVLVVSSKTEVLSLEFRRLSSLMPFSLIEKNDTNFNLADIHVFVTQEVRHMRGSDEFKRRVAENIESRAHGNFLWARLVLEDIATWHSQDAIQEALDDIPSGMENLYRRMELAILNNPRKANITLAKGLLQWTLCSRRLLNLKEISQVLRPEFPEVLDLKSTIQDLCGQFITVNTANEVEIVHQTARDYLTNDEGLVDPGKAHAGLFTKSITIFCDPQARLKLRRTELELQSSEPFLFYAATSWMYHLKNVRAASDEILEKLVEFLGKFPVLTWIHALALMGQLEFLVDAAAALTKFVTKRQALNSTASLENHQSHLDLLERWAIDLVKLVGKFSKHLLLDPSAIYKLIPPFCPEQSALHQQFHDPNPADVIVSGISNTVWSDKLARIDLPSGDRGLDVRAAADYFAVLGSKSVYVWNSANFSEICNLQHDEPVMVFCFNNKGNQILTYGLRHTRLWSIPSGRLLAYTSNPTDTKAKSMCFTENDTKILIGSDDNVIRHAYSNNLSRGWETVNGNFLSANPHVQGTVINSPYRIVFSVDGSQVGISYRGFPLAVWDVNEGYCVGRCKRAGAVRSVPAHPSSVWFAVDRFTWNPVSGHIIGLYKDGSVFKWHPVTDENKEEAQSGSDEIAASSDGKLFTTSNTDGSIKIWNFASFTVIYQLSSPGLVAGLVFSPDCRRFYDLRDCSVNAWEPDVLIHLSGDDETNSRNLVKHTPKTNLAEYKEITVVAASPGGIWYSAGDENGTAWLFNLHTGDSLEFFSFLSFFSVSQIAWGQDATHVAVSDLGGNIVIKFLVTDPRGNIKLSPIASPKVDLEGRGIEQLVFNSDSTLLLVISADYGQIWSLIDESVIATLAFDQDMNRKWLHHPTQASLFLGFGCTDVRSFQWHNFAEEQRLRYQPTRPPDYETLNSASPGLDQNTDEAQKTTINKALLTQDGKHVLVHTKSNSRGGRIEMAVYIFEILSFPETKDNGGWPVLLPFTFIPLDILQRIEIPLGIVFDSRLVFLDQDLCLYTFKLGSTLDRDKALQRHYYIPRDWMGTESLEQCCILADGGLLCLKDDEVAVIRTNLDGYKF